MSNLSSYGLIAGAAVYAAIGLIGLFLLTTQPYSLGSTDGYGTTRTAPHK